MSSAKPAPREKPIKHPTGQTHTIPFVDVRFTEYTFEETFLDERLSETPGDYSDTALLNGPCEGLPIQDKWLYIFMGTPRGAALIFGGQVSGEASANLAADWPCYAFLAHKALSPARLAFYKHPRNLEALRRRGFRFFPRSLPVCPLFDHLGLAVRLRTSYSVACDQLQRLLSNPKIQLADLVTKTVRANNDFANAMADASKPRDSAFSAAVDAAKKAPGQVADFASSAASGVGNFFGGSYSAASAVRTSVPADSFPMLEFARTAELRLLRLHSDVISRHKCLYKIKMDPQYGQNLADLASDPATAIEAMELWDKSTSEDETGFFAQLGKRDPAASSDQHWYDELLTARPLTQMLAAGGLYSTIRKVLIERYFVLEARQLSTAHGTEAAVKQAMKDFAGEVEAILNEHPSMVRDMARNGGRTFYLQDVTQAGSPKLEYKWASSPGPAGSTVAAMDMDHNASFARMQRVEASMLSVCAAVELINVYASLRNYGEAVANGQDTATAKFTMINDSAGGLGAMIALGSALAKGESGAAAIGAAAAENAGVMLGKVAAGLGLVGAVIGVGLAAEGLMKASEDDEKADKRFSVFSNAVSLTIGAFQFAGVLGAQGALVAAATGPIGIGAIFVVSVIAAWATWYFSDRLERWPVKCRDASDHAEINWHDIYSHETSKAAIECLAKEMGNLVALLHPMTMKCWVSEIVIPGLGGGPVYQDTLNIDVPAQSWMQTQTQVSVRKFQLDTLDFMYGLPVSLEVTRTSNQIGLPAPNGCLRYSFSLPRAIDSGRHKYNFEAFLDLHGNGSMISGFKNYNGKLLIIDPNHPSQD